MREELELTERENRLLFLMQSMGRRDGLVTELSTGIPSALIIGFSLWYDSWVGVASGVLAYSGYRFWVVMRQDAMAPDISSAIKKLRKQAQQGRSLKEKSADGSDVSL